MDISFSLDGVLKLAGRNFEQATKKERRSSFQFAAPA
jgi:hypothetical protein